MSAFTRLSSTRAAPPCLTWTLPPMREPRITSTRRAFSPCTLPTTRTPRARECAFRSTLTVPFTRVPVSVQLAPCGTRRLSTVTAPSEPRQVLSSALALAGASAAAANTPSTTTPCCLFMRVS